MYTLVVSKSSLNVAQNEVNAACTGNLANCTGLEEPWIFRESTIHFTKLV